MPSFSRTVTIPRPPAEVFPWLLEADLVPRWTSNLERYEPERADRARLADAPAARGERADRRRRRWRSPATSRRSGAESRFTTNGIDVVNVYALARRRRRDAADAVARREGRGPDRAAAAARRPAAAGAQADRGSRALAGAARRGRMMVRRLAALLAALATVLAPGGRRAGRRRRSSTGRRRRWRATPSTSIPQAEEKIERLRPRAAAPGDHEVGLGADVHRDPPGRGVQRGGRLTRGGRPGDPAAARTRGHVRRRGRQPLPRGPDPRGRPGCHRRAECARRRRGRRRRWSTSSTASPRRARAATAAPATASGARRRDR